jgi:hypothetical protein
MKAKRIGKTFLSSLIFLISVLALGQSGWACDDDDQWDRDWHHEWHRDHQCSTCNPPKIEIVYVDYFANSIELNIWGKNFDSGIRPVVTLGGLYELNVDDDYSDTHIIATLPLQNLNGNFVYGDYRLVVSTCHDSACKYCEDYCSKCKDKHCRDYCSKCKDRCCKAKYCKDYGHKCRCKDRYSLTIAGPAGQPGLAGALVTVIVQGKLFTYNADGGTFTGTASCVGEGMEGYTVTGGGFSGVGEQPTAKVLASKPSQDGKGWELVILGPVDVTNPSPPTDLTVWAVCAKVQ